MVKTMNPEESVEKLSDEEELLEDGGRDGEKTEMNYIDSIVHLCEKNNIEVEDIKKYLNDQIKEHLEAEAMGLNFIRNTSTQLDV